MRQVAETLIPGHAMEVNFTIKKFMELSDEERRRLYDALKGDDQEVSVHASFEILKLLTKAGYELTQYANSVLGTNFTEYFIWEEEDSLVSRAIWLGLHFSTNLKLEGDQVSIDPVVVNRRS